jgi:hypothetical protein
MRTAFEGCPAMTSTMVWFAPSPTGTASVTTVCVMFTTVRRTLSSRDATTSVVSESPPRFRPVNWTCKSAQTHGAARVTEGGAVSEHGREMTG